MSSSLPFGMKLIDTNQFGRPRSGAAYRISDNNKSILIESGTSLAAPIIEQELSNVELVYIFLTHIHLDHAGGAGVLAKSRPNVKIVVHPNGAKHLVDPEQLIKSVKKATGEMFLLYGGLEAIDGSQVHEAGNEERFRIGDDVVIRAVYAPGHAPHHMCLFEEHTSLLFVGDAMGILLGGTVIPSTPPPSFDLEKSLATLEKLKRLKPKRLCYTHFGVVDQASSKIEEYEELLGQWVHEIAKRFESGVAEEAILEEMLSEGRLPPAVETGNLRQEVLMNIAGVVEYLRRGNK